MKTMQKKSGGRFLFLKLDKKPFCGDVAAVKAGGCKNLFLPKPVIRGNVFS
jgi:hypothetical protein